MAKNPLIELDESGQSVWFDTLSRQLITSGELKRMRDEDGVRGVTSNPTIFDKAISHSEDYDEQIKQLVQQNKSAEEIYYGLVIKDIQDAADILRPIFDETNGQDGFISVEVLPGVAHDTKGTIKEVHYLHEQVNRPNVMVKIPATKEGVPAIQAMIAEGININITLIFSVARYLEVAEAYLAGMEQLAQSGKRPLNEVASVASFFVSRVDTLVDKMLDGLIEKAGDDEQRKEKLKSLKGKAAVANAKIAYQEFERLFLNGDRFKTLQDKGANLQRPLWASTSTKNPAYSDIMYVESLIGPHTVNTMPLETLEAFKDHGHVTLTVRDGIDEAHQVMQELAEVGIDLDEVWQKLEDNGVKSFADSFDSLTKSVSTKRAELLGGGGNGQGGNGHAPQEVNANPKAGEPAQGNGNRPDGQEVDLGPLRAALNLDPSKAVQSIWSKDAGFWSSKANVKEAVSKRLGWLDSPELMKKEATRIAAYVDELRRAGYKAAVLLGMGGSSLAPEVLRRTFGVAKGYLDLHVLDSTSPEAIHDLEQGLDLEHTLFLVSSKSGTTTETLAFYRYFYDKVKAIKGENAGENFIAITDKGTPLAGEAHEHDFSALFANPADIGGRYSALSYFGMVPAALIGLDLQKLLNRALEMRRACQAWSENQNNPGLVFGMQMGAAAKNGRNKLTIITSAGIASFGLWAEQLIAESTGKHGTGIIPVAGEPLGPPDVYSDDRLIVYLRLNSESDEQQERMLKDLEAAGHPVVTLEMNDIYDIGSEFFRWEFATALAGEILGINPFDEPNVQEGKDNTKRVLEQYQADGKLPEAGTGDTNLDTVLKEAKPGDYIAIMAYLNPNEEHEAQLQQARTGLRDRTKLATTLGFGPRFLHSTGQLHKGGPTTGIFIQVSGENGNEDIPIPGSNYTFGTLLQSQAIGDLQSLMSRKLPVVRMTLAEFTAAVEAYTKAAV